MAGPVTAGQAAAPKAGPPPPPWPPLRDELRLSQGPPSPQGAPTWTLQDPAAHRFFRIGWLEFEVLSRWRLGSAQAIGQAIRNETTLYPAPDSIQAVHDFALRNGLIVASTPQDSARLAQMRELAKTSLGHKIIHGYLFMRIPLLAPDAWLESNLGLVRWMFSRPFLIALICASLLGLYLVSREWVAFLLHLQTLWTWQGSLTVILALGLAKTLHELGHAFAAKHLGLRVPRMGLALMCFTPVLWTDVTEAWKLPKRADRLLVDLSGVGAELLLAAVASLIWPLLPPGDAKSAVLTLAGVTWLATLAVNANPCMRYDGYYILSDYWDIPGLQQRSFALARRHLRELLFGFGDPQPEPFPPGTRRKLILYAYSTWLYRFFLFMGIALLVYHLFFKILGLALMLVEVIWFIALPIYRELAHWHSRRKAIRFSLRTACVGLLFAALLALFVIPWRTHVEGFALLSAQRLAALYVPHPARIQSVNRQPGEYVKTDEILLTLASPDLDGRLEIVRRKLESLRSRLAAASLDPELRLSYAVDMREMQSAASELDGLTRDKARLTISAPFDGLFQDLPAWAVPGSWVPEKMKLGLVAEPGGIITAYVAEEDMERLSVGDYGLFYPLSGFFKPIPIQITALEHSAVRDIPQPELPATSPGGIIPAKRTPAGRIVPEQALYKVLCQARGDNLPTQSLTGRVFLQGERRSFAARFWQAAVGVLIRESGFD